MVWKISHMPLYCADLLSGAGWGGMDSLFAAHVKVYKAPDASDPVWQQIESIRLETGAAVWYFGSWRWKLWMANLVQVGFVQAVSPPPPASSPRVPLPSFLPPVSQLLPSSPALSSHPACPCCLLLDCCCCPSCPLLGCCCPC